MGSHVDDCHFLYFFVHQMVHRLAHPRHYGGLVDSNYCHGMAGNSAQSSSIITATKKVETQSESERVPTFLLFFFITSEELVECNRHAVMFQISGVELGCGFNFIIGIAHCNAVMNGLQHFQVIRPVTKRHGA